MTTVRSYVKASERRSEIVSAARVVLNRRGVAGTTMRSVAAEAATPLATLQYVFPTRGELIIAVQEEVQADISAVLAATEVDAGLAHAIRCGIRNYSEQLVVQDPDLARLSHDLFINTLSNPELEHFGRRQVETYVRVVAHWCRQAATNAGETSAVPFGTLARVMIGTVMGMGMYHLGDYDEAGSRRDLTTVADMLVRYAAVRPGAPSEPLAVR